MLASAADLGDADAVRSASCAGQMTAAWKEPDASGIGLFSRLFPVLGLLPHSVGGRSAHD